MAHSHVTEESTTELRPCLRELVRTKYSPPTLILRIEKIFVSNVGGSQTYRLLLTDGELAIQAVLHASIHRFLLDAEVNEGSMIILDKYEIARAKRLNGHGEVMYIAILNFRPSEDEQPQDSGTVFQLPDGLEEEGGHVELLEQHASKRKRVDNSDTESAPRDHSDGDGTPSPSPLKGSSTTIVEDDSEDEEGFESTTVNVEETNSRRQVLRELTQRSKDLQPEVSTLTFRHPSVPVPSDESSASSDDEEGSPGAQERGPASSTPVVSFNSTKSALKPVEAPLNLVTLAELFQRAQELARPMRRNYICDIFAIISWVSPDVVKRAKVPPQRDLRILDPTVADRKEGVLLTVLTDAGDFQPEVGTVGLFRRLRTHEWESISLKAYEVDCRGKEWFITDPAKLALAGLDKDKMESWWEDRRRALRRARYR